MKTFMETFKYFTLAIFMVVAIQSGNSIQNAPVYNRNETSSGTDVSNANAEENGGFQPIFATQEYHGNGNSFSSADSVPNENGNSFVVTKRIKKIKKVKNPGVQQQQLIPGIQQDGPQGQGNQQQFVGKLQPPPPMPHNGNYYQGQGPFNPLKKLVSGILRRHHNHNKIPPQQQYPGMGQGPPGPFQGQGQGQGPSQGNMQMSGSASVPSFRPPPGNSLQGSPQFPAQGGSHFQQQWPQPQGPSQQWAQQPQPQQWSQQPQQQGPPQQWSQQPQQGQPQQWAQPFNHGGRRPHPPHSINPSQQYPGNFQNNPNQGNVPQASFQQPQGPYLQPGQQHQQQQFSGPQQFPQQQPQNASGSPNPYQPQASLQNQPNFLSKLRKTYVSTFHNLFGPKRPQMMNPNGGNPQQQGVNFHGNANWNGFNGTGVGQGPQMAGSGVIPQHQFPPPQFFQGQQPQVPGQANQFYKSQPAQEIHARRRKIKVKKPSNLIGRPRMDTDANANEEGDQVVPDETLSITNSQAEDPAVVGTHKERRKRNTGYRMAGLFIDGVASSQGGAWVGNSDASATSSEPSTSNNSSTSPVKIISSYTSLKNQGGSNYKRNSSFTINSKLKNKRPTFYKFKSSTLAPPKLPNFYKPNEKQQVSLQASGEISGSPSTTTTDKPEEEASTVKKVFFIPSVGVVGEIGNKPSTTVATATETSNKPIVPETKSSVSVSVSSSSSVSKTSSSSKEEVNVSGERTRVKKPIFIKSGGSKEVLGSREKYTSVERFRGPSSRRPIVFRTTTTTTTTPKTTTTTTEPTTTTTTTTPTTTTTTTTESTTQSTEKTTNYDPYLPYELLHAMRNDFTTEKAAAVETVEKVTEKKSSFNVLMDKVVVENEDSSSIVDETDVTTASTTTAVPTTTTTTVRSTTTPMVHITNPPPPTPPAGSSEEDPESFFPPSDDYYYDNNYYYNQYLHPSLPVPPNYNKNTNGSGPGVGPVEDNVAVESISNNGTKPLGGFYHYKPMVPPPPPQQGPPPPGYNRFRPGPPPPPPPHPPMNYFRPKPVSEIFLRRPVTGSVPESGTSAPSQPTPGSTAGSSAKPITTVSTTTTTTPTTTTPTTTTSTTTTTTTTPPPDYIYEYIEEIVTERIVTTEKPSPINKSPEPFLTSNEITEDNNQQLQLIPIQASPSPSSSPSSTQPPVILSSSAAPEYEYEYVEEEEVVSGGSPVPPASTQAPAPAQADAKIPDQISNIIKSTMLSEHEEIVGENGEKVDVKDGLALGIMPPPPPPQNQHQHPHPHPNSHSQQQQGFHPQRQRPQTSGGFQGTPGYQPGPPPHGNGNQGFQQGPYQHQQGPPPGNFRPPPQHKPHHPPGGNPNPISFLQKLFNRPNSNNPNGIGINNANNGHPSNPQQQPSMSQQIQTFLRPFTNQGQNQGPPPQYQAPTPPPIPVEMLFGARNGSVSEDLDDNAVERDPLLTNIEGIVPVDPSQISITTKAPSSSKDKDESSEEVIYITQDELDKLKASGKLDDGDFEIENEDGNVAKGGKKTPTKVDSGEYEYYDESEEKVEKKVETTPTAPPPTTTTPIPTPSTPPPTFAPIPSSSAYYENLVRYQHQEQQNIPMANTIRPGYFPSVHEDIPDEDEEEETPAGNFFSPPKIQYDFNPIIITEPNGKDDMVSFKVGLNTNSNTNTNANAVSQGYQNPEEVELVTAGSNIPNTNYVRDIVVSGKMSSG